MNLSAPSSAAAPLGSTDSKSLGRIDGALIEPEVDFHQTHFRAVDEKRKTLLYIPSVIKVIEGSRQNVL